MGGEGGGVVFRGARESSLLGVFWGRREALVCRIVV